MRPQLVRNRTSIAGERRDLSEVGPVAQGRGSGIELVPRHPTFASVRDRHVVATQVCRSPAPCALGGGLRIWAPQISSTWRGEGRLAPRSPSRGTLHHADLRRPSAARSGSTQVGGFKWPRNRACRVVDWCSTREVVVGRRWTRLPDEKRRLVIKLASQGCSYRQIADQARVAQGSVGRVMRPLGGVIRPDLVEVPAGRLSLDDRIEIKLGLDRGDTFEVIGARIGRHRSTVCREIQSFERGRDGYQPTAAHRRALQRWKRPKVTKLAGNPVLCERVVDGLERLWSPQQIAHRLRAEFGDDRSMHISHETIYRSLYVQGRGELRHELAACLRTGRATHGLKEGPMLEARSRGW